jgi:PAS domain S-box-containing protein
MAEHPEAPAVKSGRKTQIQQISRSLIYIVLVICLFQMFSYGLVIGSAVQSWQHAQMLAAADRIDRNLFIALDQIARERNIYQGLLTGQHAMTSADDKALEALDKEAGQRYARASGELARNPDIVSTELVDSQHERWDHFSTLRGDIERHLKSTSVPASDETLAYELSLASADLIDQTGLIVHELTRKMGSAPDETSGRLAEASYLLWQIRDQVGNDSSALIARAQLGHTLNSSVEAALEADRELAGNFMQQLQVELRYLNHILPSPHGTDLAMSLARFHALSTAQLAAQNNNQRSPLTAEEYRAHADQLQDQLLDLYRNISDQLRQQVDIATRSAFNQLLRYILFLCMAVTLSMALLIWLHRRVLRPLKLLNEIQDAAREAILLTTAEGRIRMVNRGAETLFGRSAEQLVSSQVGTLLPDGNFDASALARLAHSGEDLQLLARQGENDSVHVSMQASRLNALRNNRGDILLIVRDDSERFRAEADRRLSLALLSDITHIQSMLFTQSARASVFDQLLTTLLQYTGAHAGLLLEVDSSAAERHFNCRAAQGVLPGDLDSGQYGLHLALADRLRDEPDWNFYPVALQGALNGLVILRAADAPNLEQVLDPLLGLYASVLGFVLEEESRKQSEIQLRDVLRMQEALFSASPAGLIHIDAQNHIVRCNQHVSQIFGYDELELPGMELETLLGSASAWETVSERIHAVHGGTVATSCGAECRNREQGQLWVLFKFRPLFEDAPNADMILACIDITTLKKTEQALREARDTAAEARGQLIAAIEAIPEAFAFYDSNDRLIVCNQHYANLYADMTPEQITGMRYEDLIRYSLRTGHEFMDDGFDTEGWISERIRRHKQAETSYLLHIDERWYQASDHNIPGLGSVCLRANITDLKEQEQELRKAKIKADEANRAKGSFLASISHEIRTPLNGILGLLELVRLGQDDAHRQESLQSIQESANTLLVLIDDILDFSKIEADRLELVAEPVAIASLMTSVHALYQKTAQNKGIDFVLDIAPTLAAAHLADPLRLRQILQNFVSNALKFTEKGSVQLKVNVLDEHNDTQTLQFVCADSGIGISQENIARLFQPFTQAESSTTRRFGGTGLGLAICRRLALLMNGKVELQSEAGQGTSALLTVTLPVTQPVASPVSQTDVSMQTSDPMKTHLHTQQAPILFVEDNPTNRKLTMMQLERLGIAFKVAVNGQEALDMWRQEPFSLILTDCHMPIMDGHQLAREIRAGEARMAEHKPVPIIACTANIAREEADNALAAGMNAVLTKPIGLQALQKALDQWLGDEGEAPAAPTTPAIDENAEPPAIDRASLEIYSQGDLQIELGILGDFISSEQEDLSGVREGVGNNDFEKTRWFTHRIKGASRMVGALRLGDAAEALELCAKTQASMQAALLTLETAYRDVVDWVEAESRKAGISG